MANPDAESVSWLRFAFASVTVIGLMAGLAFALKYVAMRGWAKSGAGGTHRLQVLTSTPVDAKRRMVVVRHNETDHVLLLGPHNDLLLSTAPAVEAPPAPETAP